MITARQRISPILRTLWQGLATTVRYRHRGSECVMKPRESSVRNKEFEVRELERQLAQSDMMIADFRRIADDLDRQIEAEERRTGVQDPSHFAYSTTAPRQARTVHRRAGGTPRRDRRRTGGRERRLPVDDERDRRGLTGRRQAGPRPARLGLEAPAFCTGAFSRRAPGGASAGRHSSARQGPIAAARRIDPGPRLVDCVHRAG